MKYMVAAHMSQSGSEDKEIIIHETTLLPNIRGFGALMSMIFAPRFHLKRDSLNSRFISVLAGLGFDEKIGALFPQHDIISHLDFDLDEDDLVAVSNAIIFTRFCSKYTCVTQITYKNTNFSDQSNSIFYRYIIDDNLWH